MTGKETSYRICFWSLVVIAMVIIYLLLTQCEEEQKDCYVCTVTTTWFYGTHTVACERDYPFCEVTEEFISNFEKINTYSDTTTKMVQLCRCK